MQKLVLLAFLVLCCLPTANAAATGQLHWTNAQSDEIGRANLDGSNVGLLNSPAASFPIGIAATEDSIYWANQNNNTIVRAQPDGSNAVVVNGTSAVNSPQGMTVDSTYIYWITVDSTFTITRALLPDATSASTLVGIPGQKLDVAVDDNYIYWSEGQHAIGRANLDGSGANNNFISTTEQTFGLAVDDNYIYWGADSAVARANLDGSGVNESFIPYEDPLDTAYGVEVDDDYIYYSRSFSGAIARADLDGSDPNPVFITGLPNFIADLALDPPPAPPPPDPPTPDPAPSPQPGPAPPAGAPALSKLAVSAPKPRRPVNNLSFSFDVSQAAKVELLVQRKYGRSERRSCERTTRKNTQRRRCPIYRSVGGTSVQSQAGLSSLNFNASSLTPGAYRATLTATNANGSSNAVRTIFYRPWWSSNSPKYRKLRG